MASYRLPFENDGQWACGTGNWDDKTWGHYMPAGPTDEQAYAWDLTHPTGGNVLAARAGVVVKLDGETADNDTSGKGPGGGAGNFIWIRHTDNSLAAYCHLKYHSLRVVVNQWVPQGYLIAQSGHNGNSSEPHLHIDVHSYVAAVSPADIGVQQIIRFEDQGHDGWRPRVGDKLASNNSQTLARQDGWRHCVKCHGLYFAGSPSSTCPAAGAHDFHGGGNYTLNLNSPAAPGQHNWRHCIKCQGLFFAGNSGSRCPVGPGMAHDSAGSGDYALVENSPDSPGQKNWRWCKKCQGLFYAGLSGSVCPAQGAHVMAGSGVYSLHVTPADTQQNWRWCYKCQGIFFAGNPVSACPAGGAHAKTGGPTPSGNYILAVDCADAPGQPGWRWCSKCQGLWMGLKSGSVCPAGGAHLLTASGIYSLVDTTYTTRYPAARGWPGQKGWRWCSKCQGLWMGSNAGSRCPATGSHILTGSGDYALQHDSH